ncbi:uncharacterized protein SPPG_01707 [Spizellomyces punctatus DAOM BR117]|uniref:NodB homology domain-containing protein n=1 Tax=Spizellomyces punctatus (strain DAOM BR117) TaxID=645134 RepID=A0A0L0HPA1_SPIPD|nr:uncharacterized protein SPPG_01707 [Spizellomyces punctatus DAOM BR117]KND02619.1 hypothetical protein SPPG_01707 [Spizellomyces punctatus DAOM BR117]|eukprot:XP_016610658.1 hypothetical protein SPPG_01707 [Spizellomyces punctatus DAOM BR117]
MLPQVASLILLAATAIAADLPLPPPMPAAWPPTDEASPIPENFLKDPLVTTALAYVQATVPPQYLNIPPSQYKSPCVATYPADTAATNCYWPNNLCVRTNDTAGFKADVVSCPGDNVWGLTYDDGPTVNVVNGQNQNDTPSLRAALDAMKLKATFFIVGANGLQNPEEIKKSFAEGHQIGVHTWTHYPATSLTNAQFVAEIKYTEAMIYNATGSLPIFWRPPCGDVDDRIRAIATALGYSTTLWTTTPVRDSTDADQTDASPATSQKIVDTVKTWFTAQKSFISLEHDISPFTSGIAINVLNEVKAAGANFPLKMMPVGTCLNQPFYRGNGTTPTSSTSTAPSATPTSVSTSTASSPASPSPTSGSPIAASAKSAGEQVMVNKVAAGLLVGVAALFALAV